MRPITTRKTGLVHRTRLLVTMAGMFLSGIAQANNCTEMPTNDNVYNIVNEATGRYMDVAYGAKERGAHIHQWSKNDRTNQQFKVRSLGDGYWSIHPVSGEERNMSLDVAGGSNSDGAEIIQWEYEGQRNQRWKFNQADNGAIKIVSLQSGKLITVAQDTNGSKLYQRSILTNHMAPHQNWYFNPVDSNCGSDKTDNGDKAPVGFASLSEQVSNGVRTTTGGGNATPIQVNSCDQLATALKSKGPAVVQLPNATLKCFKPRTAQACKFTCGSSRSPNNPDKTYLHMPGADGCAAMVSPERYKGMVDVTRNDIGMTITSNKTLEGLGPNSRVEGVSFSLNGVKNVIIRNFTIANVNPHLTEAGDAISMNNTSNIWLDHLETSMISDGHLDMYNSKNVTVSWNRFEGLNPHFCEGREPFNGFAQNSEVTYHHNYWRYSNGRNPKVMKNTHAHIYNNLWKGITGHAISVNSGAQIKVEGNYFEDTHNPQWLVDKDGLTLIDSDKIGNTSKTNVHVKRDEKTGELKTVLEDNRVSARNDTGPHLGWSIPYVYELQSARGAALDIVRKGGPQ